MSFPPGPIENTDFDCFGNWNPSWKTLWNQYYYYKHQKTRTDKYMKIFKTLKKNSKKKGYAFRSEKASFYDMRGLLFYIEMSKENILIGRGESQKIEKADRILEVSNSALLSKDMAKIILNHFESDKDLFDFKDLNGDCFSIAIKKGCAFPDHSKYCREKKSRDGCGYLRNYQCIAPDEMRKNEYIFGRQFWLNYINEEMKKEVMLALSNAIKGEL